LLPTTAVPTSPFRNGQLHTILVSLSSSAPDQETGLKDIHLASVTLQGSVGTDHSSLTPSPLLVSVFVTSQITTRNGKSPFEVALKWFVLLTHDAFLLPRHTQ